MPLAGTGGMSSFVGFGSHGTGSHVQLRATSLRIMALSSTSSTVHTDFTPWIDENETLFKIIQGKLCFSDAGLVS